MTMPSAASAPRSDAGYTAKHLSVLEGLEAVRKRPGMYIGSTDSKGLTHLAYEIVDNAVDEALAGHCERIEMTLHDDGSVEVGDDGRGIPVDVEPKSGLTGVELVMTKLHAGGKFGGGGYKTSGGLHGVGASVVNALSVAARRGRAPRRPGAHDVASAAACPGVFAGDGPHAPFTPRDGLSVAGKAPKGATGTSVRWWPDLPLFSKGSAVDVQQLHDRLRQTAFLVPGLTLARARPAQRRAGRGGLPLRRRHRRLRRAPRRSTAPSATRSTSSGSGNYKETVPVLDEQGHMVTTVVERALRGRRRAALGHRLRHPRPGVLQRRRDAARRHPPERLRAGAAQDAQRGDEGHPRAAGQRRPGHQGRRPRGADRRRDREGAGAAVPRADQGRARHPRRQPRSWPTSSRRGSRPSSSRTRSARRRRAPSSTRSPPPPRPGRPRRPPRTPPAARPRSRPPRCRPSSPTAAPPTSAAPSCGWSRATAPSAPASSRATASSRRCCRCAGRSSTSRRPASARC